jgi:ankyrin repeat protein
MQFAETTKMILEWNKDLIKQADQSTKSTPLHFAASWGEHEVIKLLLDADQSVAYQADGDGSFPIHVAAFANKVRAVSDLLKGREDCAELRDANGRTFLHVAVLEESQSVVTYASKLQSRKFASSVMNMQDKDGNTALHLAVKMGNLWIFNALMKNRQVMLNLRNNKGQTPLDLSWTTIPAGVHYGLVSN